ncbi:hypothetical protein [Bradyrhizobium sp. STM 3809]|uniref:hypothetical protein n=1 Tax=Bradyrhizobium sp. STM 3809 TaxID=551936 RepID=UPI0002406020|nr:hypothetical protein [Bradyrhizobium sp. STM 3809]CCD99370.1 hypothetical protein BRAS3809_2610011 [Bradyrhizobium sp. STM 3809]
MRISAVFTGISFVSFLVATWRYLAISTPYHLDRAESILANPNGDVVWLEKWTFSREISLACACISLVIFLWSYVALWRAQQQDECERND